MAAQAAQAAANRKKIEELYGKYRDADEPNKIGPEGMFSLLQDLKLAPEALQVLILAWKMKASTQCEFSHKEFVEGMSEMGVTSLDQLRQKLSSLEDEIQQDVSKFRDLYNFTYFFAKNPMEKSIELEAAIPYWKMLLQGRFPLLDLWAEFLQENHKGTIPKDTWIVLLTFTQKINANLSNYKEGGGWPILIDDFVVWARKKLPPSGPPPAID